MIIVIIVACLWMTCLANGEAMLTRSDGCFLTYEMISSNRPMLDTSCTGRSQRKSASGRGGFGAVTRFGPRDRDPPRDAEPES